MHAQNKTALQKAKSEDSSLLLDQFLEGIICIHFDGTITNYNLAAENILEKKQDLVLHSPFSKYFEDTLFGFSIQKTLSEKKAEPITHNTLLKKELKSFCHFGKENLMIIFEDITEAKKTEKLAHASCRLKDLGTMSAMLAHEIRNPLGGIKGLASLLRQDVEKELRLKQMADLIIDGTDRLNRLVTQILNFAHPVEINFKNINIQSVIQNLNLSLEQNSQWNSKLLSGEIKIKIKNNREEITLHSDEELLSSCLLNLMINAIQAMPEGGTLEIGAEKETKEKEHYVKITVSDTGIGIPKDNLKKIFSAFFTTKKEGSGFGLLEVNKVVQALRGTIDVESIVDEGTLFTIRIPQ